MINVIQTCQVGIHVEFSSTQDVMNYGPKLPSCKPKAGVVTLLPMRIQGF